MRASQLRGALLCTRRYLRVAASTCALGLLLNACGGNDSADTSHNTSLPVTISGADGASVSLRALPREAKNQATVRVARDGTGAPLLGDGYTPLGAVYQFTPLGWIEEAIEIRVPFAASETGDAPHLLIAQPGGDWTEVGNARVEGLFMVARVPQLAYATVAASTTPTSTSDRIRALGARITGTTSTSPLALGFDADTTTPALPAPGSDGIVSVASPTSLGLKLQYALPLGCKVAPVVSVDAVVWNPITKKLKAVALGSRSVAGNTGSAAYTQPLSASDNGTWVFASLAYCKEPGRLLPRYAVLSAGPALVVNIGTTTPTPPPAITSAPLDVSVVEGTTASFSVTATGDALSYEWQRSNDGGATYAPAGAANAPSYSLTTALADNNALFRVKVSNANGSTTSTPAKLTVSQKVIAPTVTSDPANQTVIEGETASFSVGGTGQPAPAIQWQQRAAANADAEAGWADVAGATGSTYTTAASAVSQSGAQYRALLRNAGGVAATLPATLVVNAQVIAPAIVTAPVSQSAEANFFASFNVEATGTSPLSYQWFKNGAAISGANANSVLVYAEPADVGQSYVITVEVTNSAGKAVSAPANLTVTTASTTLIKAAEGGSVSGPAGSSVQIPAGALTTDTSIGVRSLASGAVPIPADVVAFGDAFEITPAGTVFSQPVVVTLPLPATIPDGQAFAIVEIDSATSSGILSLSNGHGTPKPAIGPATNLQRLSKASGVGVPRALATTGVVASKVRCAGQAIGTEAVSFLSLVAGAKVPALVPVELCQGYGYLPPAPSDGLPADTFEGCGANDAIYPNTETINTSPELTLKNRHVFCEKFRNFFGVAKVDFDNPEQNASLGDAEIETLVTVYGESNRLSKTFEFRFRVLKYTPSGTEPDSVNPPNHRIGVNINCNFNESNFPGSCSKDQKEITLPMRVSANWSTPLSIPVRIEVPTSPGQAVFAPGVDFVYSAVGSPYLARYQLPMSRGVSFPSLRCDKGLAKKRTEGCVFTDASAVFALKSSDGVPKSRQHIQDVFAIQPEVIPGRWQLKPGTYAFTARSDALFRTRDISTIDANRAASNARCKRDFGPPPVATVPQSCPVVTDPDEDQGPCDCDEYPFASTIEGARGKSDNEFSVRRISSSDNQLAGSKLGGFYLKQRVIDNDKFWVAVP